METKKKERGKKLEEERVEKTVKEPEQNLQEEKDSNGSISGDGEEVQEDGRKEEEGLGI